MSFGLQPSAPSLPHPWLHPTAHHTIYRLVTLCFPDYTDSETKATELAVRETQSCLASSPNPLYEAWLLNIQATLRGKNPRMLKTALRPLTIGAHGVGLGALVLPSKEQHWAWTQVGPG